MQPMRLALAFILLPSLVAAADAPRPVTVVVFGDSITAPRGPLVNYAQLLKKELPAYGLDPRIINAGVPGNTTEAAKSRLQKDVLDHRPDAVVILFGTNDAAVDAWKQPPATAPRVPIETTAGNLRSLIRTLRDNKIKPVLMTAPPLRWTAKLREMYGKPPYDPADPMGFNVLIVKYNEAIRTVAREERVPLVDLYPAFLKHEDEPKKSLDDLYLDGMHPNDKGHRIIADQLVPFVVGQLNPFQHVGHPGEAKTEGLTLAAFAKPLPTERMGPFVRLKDGGILTVDGTSAFISRDEGKSWGKPIPMFPEGGIALSDERVLAVTREGTVVCAYRNFATRSKENWDSRVMDFVPEIQCDVWISRSVDNGKTWQSQLVQKGYAGAVRALAQAPNGNLALVVQDIARTPARHVVTAFYSRDDGQTWQPAACLDGHGRKRPNFDTGGHGHHDGAIEPTVEVLKDGRLWMLIRTGQDYFWQAFSRDGGATWSDFDKTGIDASAAPGLLMRLANGRLLLVWNRLYPEGKTDYERRGPHWHARPASYQREELSAALSDDEGRTWTKPVVLARRPGAWLAYAYAFERAPGEIWLTTMHGGIRIKFRANDLLGVESK